MPAYDAVIIGAGPNGLTAACTLARAGRRVLLIEARETVGGGVSSGETTLPGFIHDLGSAVHPFGVASPVFRALQLERFGLSWIQPSAPVAHPLDGGRAALLERSVRATAAWLGRDGRAYEQLMGAAGAAVGPDSAAGAEPVALSEPPIRRSVLWRTGAAAGHAAGARLLPRRRGQRCSPGLARIRCCRWKRR